MSDGPGSLCVHGGVWTPGVGVFAWQLIRVVMCVFSREHWLHINTLRRKHKPNSKVSKQRILKPDFINHLQVLLLDNYNYTQSGIPNDLFWKTSSLFGLAVLHNCCRHECKYRATQYYIHFLWEWESFLGYPDIIK